MEISKNSNSIDSKNKIKELIRELLTEIVAENHNFKVGDEVKFNGNNDGVVVKVHTSGKLKGHIDVQKKGRTSQVTLFGGDKREVRLAESILEEGEANIDASALSSLEQQLAVGLINALGHGSHPMADVKSLKYFKVDYLADIVAKNKSRLRGDVKKHIAKILKKLSVAMKENSVNEAMSDYDFLIDQLSNAMDHYDEREFVKFMSDDTQYDAKALTKLFKAYWKVNAKDRFEMQTDVNKMKKFLAKMGIKK